MILGIIADLYIERERRESGSEKGEMQFLADYVIFERKREADFSLIYFFLK